DDGVEPELRAQRLGGIAGVVDALLEQQAVDHRRQVTRDQLDARAVLLRERSARRTSREVQHATRWIPDGRAQHGVDAGAAYAPHLLESRVVERGVRADGLAGGERFRDDAARSRGA